MAQNGLLRALVPVKEKVVDINTASLHPSVRQSCVDRISKLFDHSVFGGKQFRGNLLLKSYDALLLSTSSDEPTTRIQAERLACCLEILQSFFLVADDVMDNSEMRRGKPCWFRMEGIGIAAVNDAFLLESSVESIILETFGGTPLFEPISVAFQKTKQSTIMGQMLDMQTKGLEHYNEERYTEIVRLKTSCYSFFLPVQIALILHSKGSLCSSVKEICFGLGHYFQVQDDYLDIYGDVSVTGKVGTDIQEAKCAWPIITALANASDADLQTLTLNYGKEDPKCVSAVRSVFDEMSLPTLYAKFEASQYALLSPLIDNCPVSELRPVFRGILDKLYQRAK